MGPDSLLGGGGGKVASASSSSGVNASYGTDLGELAPWIAGGLLVGMLVIGAILLWRK